MEQKGLFAGKRILCLIAAILMTLSCVLFTGCGKKSQKHADSKTDTTYENWSIIRDEETVEVPNPDARDEERPKERSEERPQE